MENQELLQAVRQIMQEELKPVHKRLDSLEKGQKEMRSEIAELKESIGEVRTGVNHLTEWANECGYVVKFPLPKL